MTTRYEYGLLYLVLSMSLLARASAQVPATARSDCQLRVATGKKGQGFSRLLRDIQRVCGAEVALCEVETEGGLHNSVALSANEADLGFVQLDTLQTMKPSDENIAALQAVLPINANLLHILALRDGYRAPTQHGLLGLFRGQDRPVVVTKLSDLKGLTVAVVGSAQLLARVVDRTYALNLHFVDYSSDDQAIAALKGGTVAAVFYMNGWPSPTLDQLPKAAGITLVGYDLPVPAPYGLVHRNYPKLGVYSLGFLAAPNLLVSRPFRATGERGPLVRALRRCLVDHLDSLREGAYEPAWKELKEPSDTYGWPQLGAALPE